MGISSLGAGAGILTQDVIDKLKAADEATYLTPITKKVSTNTEKQGTLSTLITNMASLKISASDLGDEDSYLRRSTSVVGDGVTATASSGVTPQSMQIHVDKLAKTDVWQSAIKASTSTSVASSAQTFTLTMGGTNYDLSVTGGTTMEGLRDLINNNETLSSKVTASILNVGTNEYRLIIKSDETGSDNAITFSSTGTMASDLGLDDAVTNNIQQATNAEFTYNGVAISRSSNKVTDLVVGMEFNLTKQHTNATDVASITVSRDTSSFIESFQSFVNNYNSLMSQIQDVTKFDSESDTTGIFQGDGTITGVRSSLNTILFSTQSVDAKTIASENGLANSKTVGVNFISLADYGLSVDKSGLLQLDTSKLQSKIDEDPEQAQNLFSGYTKEINSYKSEEVEGIFSKINTALGNLITGDNSKFELYRANLVSEAKKLDEEKERANEFITARYEVMQARFASYDSIITKMNSSFSSLQMQIEMAVNAQ